MKVTKTHIAVIIAIALVIITLNAIWRVRYFGMKERELRESEDAGRDSAQD